MYNCIWNDFLKDTSLNFSQKADLYTHVHEILCFKFRTPWCERLGVQRTPWFEKLVSNADIQFIFYKNQCKVATQILDFLWDFVSPKRSQQTFLVYWFQSQGHKRKTKCLCLNVLSKYFFLTLLWNLVQRFTTTLCLTWMSMTCRFKITHG